MTKKTDLQKIFDEFIGKGKIHSVELKKLENGNYVYRYKEGRRHDEIEHEDYEFLQKLHIEFGGKNPDTCRAPDFFMTLDGDWDSSTILELGHILHKIKISGKLTVRESSFPVNIPEGCGWQPLINSKRKQTKQVINVNLADVERAQITRSFKSAKEFDNFKKFILSHKSLCKLKWAIETIGTETKATGDQCVWKRLKAGDGTNRMVLELIGLNSKHFTQCIRGSLHAAADDMFFAACQRITVKKKMEQTKEICMFAAEDGKIDLTGYIAAN